MPNTQQTRAPIKAGRGTIHLTADEIAGAAYRAGFRGNNLERATATAMAETSGGFLDAAGDVGYNGPFGFAGPSSFGPWQVHIVTSPPLHTQYDPYRLISDLDYSAKAAYEISGGSNFSPWSTYKNGLYLTYMPSAKKAASRVNSNPGKQPLDGRRGREGRPVDLTHGSASGSANVKGEFGVRASIGNDAMGLDDIWGFFFGGGLLRIVMVLLGFGVLALGAVAIITDKATDSLGASA